MVQTIFHLVGTILLLSSLAGCGIFLDHEEDVSHGRVKRQMAKLGTKWDGGRVPYYFSNEDSIRQPIVRAAMNYISNRTCIRFFENGKGAQRLKIVLTRGSLCDSKVGAPGTRLTLAGEELLNVGDCLRILGVMFHELGHSLGSYHEHSRPDRDEYIDLNETQIERTTGPNSNLRIVKPGFIAIYVPFDYGSAMLYNAHAFGYNSMLPKDKNYEKTMGSRRITFYDIDRINQYYQCKCPVELPCTNGGYTLPGDCSKCLCPSGFFGKLCNERPSDKYYELKSESDFSVQPISFNYSDTGDNLAHFKSTYAYISAPAGRTIEISLWRMQNIVCVDGCNFNGIEVKFKEDRRVTSPIICCPNQEILKNTILSKNNPTVIEMYSREAELSSVIIRYRYF